MTKEVQPASDPDHGSSAPRATAVQYDRASDQIRLVLTRGVTLVFPRKGIEELRDLSADHMENLSLIGDGEALVAEADDVHVFVPGLVRFLIGDFMLQCI